jgi:hypothetical protein
METTNLIGMSKANFDSFKSAFNAGGFVDIYHEFVDWSIWHRGDWIGASGIIALEKNKQI